MAVHNKSRKDLGKRLLYSTFFFIAETTDTSFLDLEQCKENKFPCLNNLCFSQKSFFHGITLVSNHSVRSFVHSSKFPHGFWLLYATVGTNIQLAHCCSMARDHLSSTSSHSEVLNWVRVRKLAPVS